MECLEANAYALLDLPLRAPTVSFLLQKAVASGSAGKGGVYRTGNGHLRCM